MEIELQHKVTAAIADATHRAAPAGRIDFSFPNGLLRIEVEVENDIVDIQTELRAQGLDFKLLHSTAADTEQRRATVFLYQLRQQAAQARQSTFYTAARAAGLSDEQLGAEIHAYDQRQRPHGVAGLIPPDLRACGSSAAARALATGLPLAVVAAYDAAAQGQAA